MLRAVSLSFGLLLLLGAATASATSFTYGPIVGRGETGDKVIVKWGTSSSSATTLYYKAPADPTWQTASGASSTDHEVTLTGLAASATYQYSFDASGASPTSFATCPAPGAPLDVVFYGDSRAPFLGTSQHPMVIAAVATAHPDLVLNSGDLTYGGSFSEMQSSFLPQIVPLASSTPYMAAPGNHDDGAGLVGNFSRPFPTPRGASEAWRAYYAFVCGNSMFISLNSNDVGNATQLQFIKDKLAAAAADATIDHVFAFFHHAPYSVGTHGDTSNVKSSWVPLFDAAPKMAAVFTGHDHNYGHYTNGGHVAYVVSGGAGADLYDINGSTSATKGASKNAYHYVKVHIAGLSLQFAAIDTSGTTIDSFDNGQAAPTDLGSSGGGDGGTNAGDLAAGGGCAMATGRTGGAPIVLALLLLGLALGRRRTRRAVAGVVVALAVGLSLGAAGCGGSSPPATTPDLGTFVAPGPGPMCVASCTTDAQCQNSCPVLTNGIHCCDSATNTCFPSQAMMCPAPVQDFAVSGPY